MRSRNELPRTRGTVVKAGVEATELTRRSVGETGKIAIGAMHFAKGQGRAMLHPVEPGLRLIGSTATRGPRGSARLDLEHRGRADRNEGARVLASTGKSVVGPLTTLHESCGGALRRACVR